MKPWSLPVVIGTLLIGWPALWAAQVDGTLSSDVAFQRLLLCLFAAWAGCALVASISTRTVEANEAAVRAAEKAILDAEAAALAEREAEEAARLEAETERPADAAPFAGDPSGGRE